MTPEQESLSIQTAASLSQGLEALNRVVQNHEVLIAEIREGQAMLGQYFREALDRFDERTRAIERRPSRSQQLRPDLMDSVPLSPATT
ncbi:hypothetical protein NW813_03590 [Synechococcus sp. R55.6]|jgi:hypothetical protein|uniref:hypothetical protein n=1 Tax=unclassified Synechococcus TaxID=2626047 RepID=UPI0039C3ECCD